MKYKIGLSTLSLMMFYSTTIFAHCPNGYIEATYEDALTNVRQVCGIIGKKETVRLANGGSMSGSHLGCTISKKSNKSYQNTLCKKPLQFYHIEGDHVCDDQLTIVDAITAVTYSERACEVLNVWSISRLADGGSMSGSGYKCGVRKNDNRLEYTRLGHTLCAKYEFVKGKIQHY